MVLELGGKSPVIVDLNVKLDVCFPSLPNSESAILHHAAWGVEHDRERGVCYRRRGGADGGECTVNTVFLALVVFLCLVLTLVGKGDEG